MPFHSEILGRAIELQRSWLAAGARVGWHDVQMVATAAWTNQTLLTRDASLLEAWPAAVRY